MESKLLNVVDVGLMNYGEALRLQERLVELRARDEIEDTLILVEHPLVITRGLRARQEGAKLSSAELEKLGISIYDVERGGYSFLHSPGQIVGYPIRLVDRSSKIDYMAALQKTMLNVAQSYGVNAITHPNFQDTKLKRRYFGAWYKRSDEIYDKIGAMAVKFVSINDRHVTMHGFAFNVNNDTSLFDYINMCGFQSETCTSLRDILGRDVPLEGAKSRILDSFAENLGYTSVRIVNTLGENLLGIRAA